MNPRVGDAVSQAFNRTGRLLFKPFDAATWFILGFAAWLAHLFRSGGSGVGNYSGWNTGGGGGQPGGPFDADNLQQFTRQVERWLDQHWAWVTGTIVGATLLLTFIMAVVQWLRARGTFMFIDGVVTGAPTVAESWKAFKTHGNSLFGLLLAVALLSMLFFLTGMAMIVALVWPELRTGDPDPGVLLGAIGGGVAYFIVQAVAFYIVGIVIIDFIAPAMHLRDCSFGEGWRAVRREIFTGRKGLITRYVLMRFVLDIGASFAVTMLTCLTCCIASIPYLGTVIALPIYTTLRSYSLCFLDQFGPEWRVFAPDATEDGSPR